MLMDGLSVDIAVFIITNLMVGFFCRVWNMFGIQYLPILVYIIPIYVFIQRVHNQSQQRALKSINDEVIKVNDFVIEFIHKIESQVRDAELDDKTIYELRTLKSKINAHINYMTDYLMAFPYGGPLNFAVFFITGKYFSTNAMREAEQIEVEYQDLIINETILSLEIEFIVEKKIQVSYSNLKELNVESIDWIIHTGSKLQQHLEENTRKMY